MAFWSWKHWQSAECVLHQYTRHPKNGFFFFFFTVLLSAFLDTEWVFLKQWHEMLVLGGVKKTKLNQNSSLWTRLVLLKHVSEFTLCLSLWLFEFILSWSLLNLSFRSAAVSDLSRSCFCSPTLNVGHDSSLWANSDFYLFWCFTLFWNAPSFHLNVWFVELLLHLKVLPQVRCHCVRCVLCLFSFFFVRQPHCVTDISEGRHVCCL